MVTAQTAVRAVANSERILRKLGTLDISGLEAQGLETVQGRSVRIYKIFSPPDTMSGTPISFSIR